MWRISQRDNKDPKILSAIVGQRLIPSNSDIGSPKPRWVRESEMDGHARQRAIDTISAPAGRKVARKSGPITNEVCAIFREYQGKLNSRSRRELISVAVNSTATNRMALTCEPDLTVGKRLAKRG